MRELGSIPPKLLNRLISQPLQTMKETQKAHQAESGFASQAVCSSFVPGHNCAGIHPPVASSKVGFDFIKFIQLIDTAWFSSNETQNRGASREKATCIASQHPCQGILARKASES
jgi:hypothetical protein